MGLFGPIPTLLLNLGRLVLQVRTLKYWQHHFCCYLLAWPDPYFSPPPKHSLIVVPYDFLLQMISFEIKEGGCWPFPCIQVDTKCQPFHWSYLTTLELLLSELLHYLLPLSPIFTFHIPIKLKRRWRAAWIVPQRIWNLCCLTTFTFSHWLANEQHMQTNL